MFKTKIKTVLIILLLAFAGVYNYAQQYSDTKKMSDNYLLHKGKNTFAIVELFTSESCSSCPPADKLIGELSRKYKKENRNVFLLAFHVDYWNHLNWKDPFSSPEFSQRQRDYANSFRSRRIYTPQMIINGQKEFVGSQKNTAIETIETALSLPGKTSLHIDKKSSNSSKTLHIIYEIYNAPKNSQLNLALVESGLTRQISSGENSGRTLHLDNVVRAFSTQKVENPEGEIKIAIPENVNTKKAALVCYIQDTESLAILAADGFDL